MLTMEPQQTSSTIYSEKLRKDMTLKDEALDLYKAMSPLELTTLAFRDPYYVQELSNLGFTPADAYVFKSLKPYVPYIIELGLSPEQTAYIGYFLNLFGSNHPSRNSWLKESLPLVNVKKAKKLELKGWTLPDAIIISAFPERKTRLASARKAEIAFYKIYIESYYDIDLLARLHHSLDPAETVDVIDALKNGYTEKEIQKYGLLLTAGFPAEELRKSNSNPESLKNIFSVFEENTVPTRKHEKKYFTPTIAQLDTIIASGITTAHDYENIANMFDMETMSPMVAKIIPIVLGAITYEELQEIHGHMGTIESLGSLFEVVRYIEAGMTIEQYFQNDWKHKMASIPETTITEFPSVLEQLKAQRAASAKKR